MPRTSYKVDFIREIDKLLTLAYIFELLFDDTDFIPFELVEYCEQIYPTIQEIRYLAPRDQLSRSHHFFMREGSGEMT
jgi:hypothetical protein